MSQPNPKDPFFGLKYIAFCRTGLIVDGETLDEEAMLAFAKWQICKVRNILWNDPVWDNYTNPEILIEYFAIKFDEDADLRTAFEASTVSAKEADVDWFERMEKKLKEGSKIKEEVIAGGTIEELPQTPSEFEDKF